MNKNHCLGLDIDLVNLVTGSRPMWDRFSFSSCGGVQVLSIRCHCGGWYVHFGGLFACANN